MKKDISDEIKHNSLQTTCDIISDLARFRLDLKRHRFTHRVFNRMELLEKPEDITLSKQASTLYKLSLSIETEETQTKILQHTVLKADVRGSTTVTEELERSDLNPASYFSLRFFSPINEILHVYGANKVFIEGDAIILSFLEYENKPEQWFSVARACGLSKAILNIIRASNRYSQQMGLPPLELGIGICYSPDSPRFLYDEDKPIMISSAIGMADRMSSCSWKLRESMNPEIFNVEVLSFPKGEKDLGEKGQQIIQYNVNGILLENSGLKKLAQEIHLRQLDVEIDSTSTTFLYGIYPDMEGKKRELVLRQGRVGTWRNNTIQDPETDAAYFYEVVTNSKVISKVLKSAIKTRTARYSIPSNSKNECKSG
jgi:hypothetical protein